MAPSGDSARPARRSVLVAAALLASGCGAATRRAAGAASSPPATGPLDLLAAAERQLIGGYAAAIAAHPAIAPVLRLLRADHEEHLVALRRAGARTPEASPSTGSPSAGSALTSSPGRFATGTDETTTRMATGTIRTTVATLRAAERRTAARFLNAAGAAGSGGGGDATLLGGIAASDASHDIVLAALLTGAPGRR